MFVDFIQNGQGGGDVGGTLADCRFDAGLLRPFIDKSGKKCVMVNSGDSEYDEKTNTHNPIANKVQVSDLVGSNLHLPVHNATLSLRKDQWVQMDQAVLGAARQRLRAWTDLASANTFGGFNGMGKLMLESESISDPGEAIVDMDGLSEGRSDEPQYKLNGLPLPITHSDFFFSSRKIAIGRSGGGTPLDTSMAESAGRRVAEAIEKTVIGVQAGISYGAAAEYGGTAPQVYGYTNHPDRTVKTNLTAPTNSNGTTVVGDVLAMRELLYAAGFYGPFMLYVSTGYDQHLDNDLKSEASITTRQRLNEIDGINGVKRLDYLTGNVMLLVQMTSDVARAVNGMNMTTVQWETKGGMQVNFKVMGIMVPQIRSDFSGNCGVCHGTTS